jgi:hypothetical protein
MTIDETVKDILRAARDAKTLEECKAVRTRLIKFFPTSGIANDCLAAIRTRESEIMAAYVTGVASEQNAGQPSRELIKRVLLALEFKRLGDDEVGGAANVGDWENELGELIDDDALDHPNMLPKWVSSVVWLCYRERQS